MKALLIILTLIFFSCLLIMSTTLLVNVSQGIWYVEEQWNFTIFITGIIFTLIAIFGCVTLCSKINDKY